MICGSTTRIATCQVEAPSVCALIELLARQARDLQRQDRGSVYGVTPMTISMTFDNSPSPNTMNRIGRTAIGGIIEITATSVPKRRARDRQQPDRQAEAEADQRSAMPSPSSEPPQAGRGVGPQHVFAGPPVRLGRQPLAMVAAISRDRRQQLVVGIGGAPLRRSDRHRSIAIRTNGRSPQAADPAAARGNDVHDASHGAALLRCAPADPRAARQSLPSAAIVM